MKTKETFKEKLLFKIGQIFAFVIGGLAVLFLLVSVAGMLVFYSQIVFRVFRPFYCEKVYSITTPQGIISIYDSSPVWSCDF